MLVWPAQFKARAGTTPFQAITDVKPDTRLSRITRDEVAIFVLDQLSDDRYLHRAVFIGHAT